MIEKIALPYPQSTLDLFQKLRQLPLPILLHSGSGNKYSRFDIMVAAPDRILRSSGNQTWLEDEKTSTDCISGHPIDALAAQFPPAGFEQTRDPDLPFCGGALGYFAYDMSRTTGKPQGKDNPDLAFPEMLIGIYNWSLIVDHELKCCTLVFREDCMQQKKELLLSLLKSETASSATYFSLTGEFQSNFSKEGYLQAFGKIMDYINAGDCYQVNLAQRYSAPCQGDSYTAFSKLQTAAKAPFAAYMEDGKHAILSFSPERFLKVENKQVLTQPIKGTRPRLSEADADKLMREELQSSVKDKAENLMIVDLLRNDLGRVCETGSVRVDKLFEIESFANVHHLISSVCGRLKNSSDVFPLLKACFPGGSITGTPKIRAMEIIEELETRARHVYCGSIAYIGFDGSMDSNICIRTLLRTDDMIHCWGGGGIVSDSSGEQEYQETLDKISIFLNNL